MFQTLPDGMRWTSHPTCNDRRHLNRVSSDALRMREATEVRAKKPHSFFSVRDSGGDENSSVAKIGHSFRHIKCELSRSPATYLTVLQNLTRFIYPYQHFIYLAGGVLVCGCTLRCCQGSLRVWAGTFRFGSASNLSLRTCNDNPVFLPQNTDPCARRRVLLRQACPPKTRWSSHVLKPAR